MSNSDLATIVKSLHDFGRPASITEIANDVRGKLTSKSDADRAVTTIIAKHMKDFHGKLSLNTVKSGKPAYFLAQRDQHANQLWLLDEKLTKEDGINPDLL